MNARTMRSLKTYFSGYRALAAKFRAADAAGHAGVAGFFSRLRKDIPALRTSHLQNELLRAPRFNIFRVLPVERRETLLHSPLLANLLDPTASHGQGCLFLRTFFDVAYANARLIRPVGLLEPDEWSVRTEVYIGNGTIDLLIESPKQRYALVIENKIDAFEQHAQLSRYHRWLRERRGDFTTRQLVFLTPTGRASELNPRVPCALLSYQRDILELLSRTIPTIQPPHLKELLSEYQAVLTDWAQENTHEQTTH